MSSNPSVSTLNDRDSPLAVVADWSGATAGACNNGDPPPTVAISQGMETNSIAQSSINGVFPFKRLPIELQDKIIGYAMRAINRKIGFACLTNAIFKPNVAVGLLLVDHRIYHEAHYQLRKQNSFVFNNFGSDIKTVASSVGPLKCRSGACGYDPLKSILANVVFDVGDEDLPDSAQDKLHAFGCALRQLRSPIIINSLYIRFAYHSFRSSAQLSDFASTMNKIKVQESLIVSGDEHFLDINLEDLPRGLGMEVLPVYSRTSAATFLHEYKPKMQAKEDTDILVADQTRVS